MKKTLLLSVAFMMLMAVALVGSAGPAGASTDDAVDPLFYNNYGPCTPYYPHPDPLGSYGGAPGLTAYIFKANAGCNQAIWSDYGFTHNRWCSIDVYVSGSANANVNYHIEDVAPDGTINFVTYSMDQDPYYGWVRIEDGLQAWNITTIWIDDTTWGTSKQSIGAAGIDFTCR